MTFIYRTLRNHSMRARARHIGREKKRQKERETNKETERERDRRGGESEDKIGQETHISHTSFDFIEHRMKVVVLEFPIHLLQLFGVLLHYLALCPRLHVYIRIIYMCIFVHSCIYTNSIYVYICTNMYVYMHMHDPT